MLWTAGVHIHDPWTQLFCLYNLFKTKKGTSGFHYLYPHPISTSLFASPNGYQKLGSDNHASIMDGASVYHDPLPYLWCCSVPSKIKCSSKWISIGSTYFCHFFVHCHQWTRRATGKSQHFCLVWRYFIFWTSASNTMMIHPLLRSMPYLTEISSNYR